MNELIDAIQNLINPKYRPLALGIGLLLPRGFYALKNGGGVKDILCAMFLGTNAPATPAAPTAPAQTPGKIPLLILVTAFGLALTVGCASNQQATVYKSATAVQTSVETVMTAWGNYVQAANPPDSLRAQVAQAYNKYQLAMLTLIDAETALGTVSAGSNTNAVNLAQGQATAASAAVNQALQDLVTLVQTFGVKL